MHDNPTDPISRRHLLQVLSGVGIASIAGCAALEQEADTDTSDIDRDTARDLAERFAPLLYFDVAEQWFPTDPRPYATERDGDTVVDGFDALNGYTSEYSTSGPPPEPMVFYHAVGYADSPLAVVQYWMYSAFDQFSTNFHWHDWEVLHVFVDTDTEQAQLYVGSSHSRMVPNNEFLDPDPDRIPRILTELGSHSSALSINDQHDQFQRLPTGGTFADITNSAIEGIEDLAEIPLAYGLPRDEGTRFPFVVPVLDDVPLYEHDNLPSVTRDDLIPDRYTVRSFDALNSPPTDLPARETGLVFGHSTTATDEVDVEYTLTPTRELEHIAEFTGPQLSFEFAIPDIVEDALASHITSTGTPWHDPRYDNPATDITDPSHRAALADRYDAIGDPSPANSVIAMVTEAVTNEDAPDNEGLTTDAATVESLVFLESEPIAIPTFGGITAARGVPEGEHRLTVNGAGIAPHSETISVTPDGHPTVPGVNGEVPVVARENAVKLEVEPQDPDGALTALALEDDFAGRLYDAPLSGPDAVYIHRGGAYTTEVRDTAGEIGAFRVNPSDEQVIHLDEARTGKAVLAEFLGTIAAETRTAVEAVETDQSAGDQPKAITGLSRALAAVAEAANRAAEQANAGNRSKANTALETVAARLEDVGDRLGDAKDALPAALARAVDRRLAQARRRVEQAKAADKL